MSVPEQNTQVAVIGAGPGGYAAAFRAADLGLQVTLIDPQDHPGGVCLYRGCIPSKALLHLAKVIAEARHVAEAGIRFAEPEIDFAQVMQWKQGVVDKLTKGLGHLVEQRKVQFIKGMASFQDSQSLRVRLVHGGERVLHFEHAILATGSRPVMPFDEALSGNPHLLNSTDALNLSQIPQTLLVIGGGYIGLELATVYAAFGTKVTVVEMTDRLLSGCDADLVKPLHKKLIASLAGLHLKTKVVDLVSQKNGMEVTMESSAGQLKAVYEKVLVAVGRRPNSSGFGLEHTRVRLDERGFAMVDPQRRTDDPTIFAIGDVCGEPLLAHKATHEGLVAAEAIAGNRVSFEPRAIPAVVFTDPEIAWCGLTEEAAKSQGIRVEVTRFPWAASGRALTMGAADGLTKLLIDPEHETILGFGIVGSGAGELIAEGVIAIEMGTLAADLKLSIHAHPTLSETVMEASELFYGPATHIFKPKRRPG